jgi:hypothetical protein
LKTLIPDIWSNNSGHESPPNQKSNQKTNQQRESAHARDPLSGAGDFHDGVEGEILPPESQPGRSRGKPTPLPSDWQPTGEDWLYAANQGLTGDDIDREAQAFQDWNAARGKTSHDWPAEWRLWVGRSRQNRNSRPRTQQPGDKAREMARQIEAMETAMRSAGLDPNNPADRRKWTNRPKPGGAII